jgi:hypothetical protein
MGYNSLVSLTTRYGLGGPEIETGRGEILRTR